MKLLKEIREGERLPKHYGPYYARWDGPIIVCALFPLNIIMGIVRSEWLFFRYFYFNRGFEKISTSIYTKGFNDGVRAAKRIIEYEKSHPQR